VIDFGRRCSRHRRALVDFVDRGDVGPATAAALAHLDRCDRCTEAIESTVLTITALRRFGESLDAAGPSPDAWPRLAERITSWRRRPVAMSPLTGLAMSVAVVFAVVLPFQLGPTDLGGAAGSGGPSVTSRPGTPSDFDAIRAAQRAAPDPQSRSIPIVVDGGTQTVTTHQVVGEDVRVMTKEVNQSEPASRLARPI
jgi:hypothetical protein